MPHLIPFAGRNYSGATTQNLLWRDGNVYLMDNHRAALWCWQQHIDLYAEAHSLIHIDRHYDALQASLSDHMAIMPDLRGLPIQDYLAATIDLSPPAPLFRWDNYLSIYLERMSGQLDLLRLLTHGDGDRPKFRKIMESGCDELPQNIDYWLEGRWIVNIDLDYFFCADAEDGFIQMFSGKYLDATFQGLRRAMDSGNVAVVTVCLTPSNFTPGWAECLRMSRRIFSILGKRHPRS